MRTTGANVPSEQARISANLHPLSACSQTSTSRSWMRMSEYVYGYLLTICMDTYKLPTGAPIWNPKAAMKEGIFANFFGAHEHFYWGGSWHFGAVQMSE